MTDVFLSTILWTYNPSENENLNRKLLLCECYNNIQLDSVILARFFDDIKKKKLALDITENQYLTLTTSTLALHLLGDKTQNDINAYTDRTPNEILQILEQEHKNEIENAIKQGEERLKKEQAKNDEELKKQQEQHVLELAEKDTTITGLSKTVNYTDQKCKKYASWLAKSISFIVFLALGSIFLLNHYIPSQFWQKYPNAKLIWYVVDVLLVLWSVWNMFGKPIKYLGLKDYVYNRFNSKFVSGLICKD